MIQLGQIFAPRNRGLLLDVIVFVVNLVLMFVLAGLFANLVRAAQDDQLARSGIILFCLGVVFLQPLGSILKRRRAHERNPDLDRPSPHALFHPALYFLSKLVFLIAAAGLIVEVVFGPVDSGPSADYFGLPSWVFASLFLGVPALAIANTVIVYMYFWKPKHPAMLKFLESSQSETLGDVCLFVNMILFQMYWALLMRDLPHDNKSLVDRLFLFAFSALLIYLPPRLFYLAEDGQKPLTWVMMFAANVPVLVRIVFSAR